MKHLKLFFYAFTLVLVFSSCTEEELTNSEKIVGNWKMTDFHGTTEATTTDPSIDMTITATSVQEGSNYNSFINFTENPNNYTVSGTMKTHMTVTTVMIVDGETTTNVTEDDYDSEPTENGTWSIDGDKITVTTTYLGQEKTTTATIQELSNTVLTIKSYDVINTEVDGVTSNTIIEFYQTYEKQ